MAQGKEKQILLSYDNLLSVRRVSVKLNNNNQNKKLLILITYFQVTNPFSDCYIIR